MKIACQYNLENKNIPQYIVDGGYWFDFVSGTLVGVSTNLTNTDMKLSVWELEKRLLNIHSISNFVDENENPLTNSEVSDLAWNWYLSKVGNPTMDDAREYREKLLRKTDWTQLPESKLSAKQMRDAESYRQALRDIPQTYVLAADVIFPTEPDLSFDQNEDTTPIDLSSATAIADSKNDYCYIVNETMSDLNDDENGIQATGFGVNNSLNSNPSVFSTIADDGVVVNENGIYVVMINVHQETNRLNTNVGIEITIDGQGTGIVGASAYISNIMGHKESSAHVSACIKVNAGQKIGFRGKKLANSGTVVVPAGKSNITIMKVGKCFIE